MKRMACWMMVLMMGLAAQAQAGQFANAVADYTRKAAAGGELVYLNALCVPLNTTLPGPYGGTLAVDGSFCGVSGTFNMVYTDYQSAPELTCNGSLSAGLGFDNLMNPTYLEITMDGGPLDYTYQGQAYTVYYENVVAQLDIVTAQFTSVSGNVVINNQTYPLDDTLADLLIL